MTIFLIHIPNLPAWLTEVGRGSWLLWLLPRCEIFCEARGDRRSFLPFVFSKRDASPVRRLPPMRAEQQRPASHRRSSPKNHRQQSAHVIMRLRMGSSPWSRLTALANYGSSFITFIALLIHDRTLVFPLIVFGDKQKEEWGIPYFFQHQLLIREGPKNFFFQQIFLNLSSPLDTFRKLD